MSGMRRFFRDADWLDGARAWRWCACLAALSAFGLAIGLALSPHGVTRAGNLLGPDFVTFYGAGSFVQDGQAVRAYHHATFLARLKTLLPQAATGDYAFLYPPGMLLLCAGFAALPYMAALSLRLGTTLLTLLAALRTLPPPRPGWLATLAYPAILINLGNGQNAFATSACFAAAMAFGDRAPMLAGASLDLLAVKPQLAVLVPVGLGLAGQWRALAACGAAAFAVCLGSAVVFGAGTWSAWLASAPLSRTVLEQGSNGYANMLSLFAAVRLLHGGVGSAYTAQALAAAAVLVILARALPRRTTLVGAVAATAAATLLATPWSLDYDLTILAGPLAWMFSAAMRTGWRPWEKITLLAAYLLPLLTRIVATDLHVILAPCVLLPLLLLVVRRASADLGGPSRSP